jgi:hypothetical protein
MAEIAEESVYKLNLQAEEAQEFHMSQRLQ